jgi:hypothetical protein
MSGWQIENDCYSFELKDVLAHLNRDVQLSLAPHDLQLKRAVGFHDKLPLGSGSNEGLRNQRHRVAVEADAFEFVPILAVFSGRWQA